MLVFMGVIFGRSITISRHLIIFSIVTLFLIYKLIYENNRSCEYSMLYAYAKSDRATQFDPSEGEGLFTFFLLAQADNNHQQRGLAKAVIRRLRRAREFSRGINNVGGDPQSERRTRSEKEKKGRRKGCKFAGTRRLVFAVCDSALWSERRKTRAKRTFGPYESCGGFWYTWCDATECPRAVRSSISGCKCYAPFLLPFTH